MREIPVPKPTSRPATPLKTEPANPTPAPAGFTTPPSATPTPGPVSPVPTPYKQLATVVCIDDDDGAADPCVPEEPAQEPAPAAVHTEPAQEQAPDSKALAAALTAPPPAEKRESKPSAQVNVAQVQAPGPNLSGEVAQPVESGKGLSAPQEISSQQHTPPATGFDKRNFNKSLESELEKLTEEQLSELIEAARRKPELPTLLCGELGIEEGGQEAADAIKEFGTAEPLDELLWFHTEIAEEQALRGEATTPSNLCRQALAQAPSLAAPAKATSPQAPAKATPPPPPAKASTPKAPPASVPKPKPEVPDPSIPKQAPKKAAFTEDLPASKAPVNFKVVGPVLWL